MLRFKRLIEAYLVVFRKSVLSCWDNQLIGFLKSSFDSIPLVKEQ